MNVVMSIVSALIQVGLILVVPLAWWALTARRTASFLRWIGLHRIETDDRARLVGESALTTLGFGVIGALLLSKVGSAQIAASSAAGKGAVVGTLMVLVQAIVQTGLSEEILFRGFIGKRVSAYFGFPIGNAVQAVLFGLAHVAPFWSVLDSVPLVLAIGVFTGAVGWAFGRIDERLAGGSILPSWAMHALVNAIVGVLVVHRPTLV